MKVSPLCWTYLQKVVMKVSPKKGAGGKNQEEEVLMPWKNKGEKSMILHIYIIFMYICMYICIYASPPSIYVEIKIQKNWGEAYTACTLLYYILIARCWLLFIPYHLQTICTKPRTLQFNTYIYIYIYIYM